MNCKLTSVHCGHREFITGFRKRKQERRKKAEEERKNKLKKKRQEERRLVLFFFFIFLFSLSLSPSLCTAVPTTHTFCPYRLPVIFNISCHFAMTFLSGERPFCSRWESYAHRLMRIRRKKASMSRRKGVHKVCVCFYGCD
jgi:hypothetical protein